MIARSSTKHERKTMISRLFLGLVFVALVSAAGAFVVLAAWDVPVKQTTVEKALDNTQFLEKSTL